MGKVGGGGATTVKKQKGRPSLSDLKKRAFEKEQLRNQQQIRRRSTRRNPNSTAATSAEDVPANEDEYYEEDDDDDDERKEKKVKLVVRLPESNQLQQNPASSDLIRSSSVNLVSCGSDSNADLEDRKINPAGSVNIIPDNQGKKISKTMENRHGSPLESGHTTPLPDKRLLVFILDRLQKKDTYGVFSEPVDPDELPDYHEIVEHPMDFGTVKRKLDGGLYSSLNELEADVFLICSNAMRYNSSETIYFRQARTIEELAKRDFGNLRQEGEDGSLQPKVVKRGRPPSKHLKKAPPLDPSGPESTSGATLATTQDDATEHTAYNLRRGPNPYSELLSDWNEEFPARIRRADMKYGNKHFIIDETRRETYVQHLPSVIASEASLFSNHGGERKRLMAVGLHAEHGYARSLARFANNLGPSAWKVASKKIEKALPLGVKYAQIAK